mgnify:FL=1
MANFKDNPIYKVHNDYYTPKSAWEQIQHLIPKDNTIYEAFMLNSNGQSKKFLQELGYNVVGDTTINYLTNSLPKESYDLIISNPPFEKIIFSRRLTNLKYMCIKKLFDNDKPFIILLNATNLFSKWFKELSNGKEADIKFIIPSHVIKYDKYEKGGITRMKNGKSPSFKSVYITYKVLDKNIWI